MEADKLQIYEEPQLREPKLILGFSGWMDGGEVSSGTVQGLINKLDAKYFAEIEPEGFYIYNFPGMMETAAMFRPFTRIKDGLIEAFEFPANSFFVDQENDLILFIGKEPNLLWEEYADCIFSLCEQLKVSMIYYIGSVSSLVPHTREPKLLCTASCEQLKENFQHYGVNFADYKGPASIATYLLANCPQMNLAMVNLVATVPAYVQGNNPKCIEAITQRLTGMLDLDINLDDLKLVTEDFEKKLTDLVQQQPDLAGNICRLEEDYDNDIFNNEMSEIKEWLEQQGIRLD
jgi:proteasome assembly chaperone (PAC2) family protein